MTAAAPLKEIEEALARAVASAQEKATAAAIKRIEAIIDARISEILSGELGVEWVRSSVVCRVKGYTDDAIRANRRKGVWCEGIEFIKAPDGKYRYSLKAIDQWEAGKR